MVCKIYAFGPKTGCLDYRKGAAAAGGVAVDANPQRSREAEDRKKKTMEQVCVCVVPECKRLSNPTLATLPLRFLLSLLLSWSTTDVWRLRELLRSVFFAQVFFRLHVRFVTTVTRLLSPKASVFVCFGATAVQPTAALPLFKSPRLLVAGLRSLFARHFSVASRWLFRIETLLCGRGESRYRQAKTALT